jgi:PAS domain S-box-containing protein
VRVSHEQKLYGLMGVSVPATFTVNEEETGLVDEVGEDIGFALHAIVQDEMGRRASEELRRERDITASLLDASPVAIAVVDAGGVIVQANAEAERVLGLRKDGITQRTYNDPAWHNVDYDGNPFPVEQLPVSRVLREKRAVYGVEHAIQWSTGERVLLSINAAPVYSDEGHVAQIVCTMQDVTAQRRTEAALRESEEKYRSLFEQSGEAVSVVALDGRILDANPAWLTLFGCTRDELPHLNISDFYASPGGRADFLRRIAGVGWLKDDVRFKRRDGTVFLCERSAVELKDASGAAIGYQATVRDITERERTATALRESEERYRSLFDQAMDAIWLLRPDGTGNVVNKAWLDLFGYDAADIPSLTAMDLYADPADRADFLRRIAETGYVRDEVRFKRKDGTVFECERSVAALKDAAGRVVSFQGVIRDITERKRAAKELAESRENLRLLAQRVQEAREEERTAIARELHDRVGQTLTAVKLDIERLRKVVEESHPELSRLVDGMTKLVDDGADDVRRISSDLRPGALDDLGLAGAIEWQLDQLRPRTDLVLTFRCDEGDCELDASRRTALFRVFQELVTNVVRHAGAKKVDVSLRREPGALVLDVIDDGCGIDAAQVNDRHSIGIVGMRERLLPYGGELHIEGVPGQGTVARVTLPTE